jgi:hypothetical protein
LYYAALEHREETDPEVVMPEVSLRTAKERIDKAFAEPSEI